MEMVSVGLALFVIFSSGHCVYSLASNNGNREDMITVFILSVGSLCIICGYATVWQVLGVFSIGLALCFLWWMLLK